MKVYLYWAVNSTNHREWRRYVAHLACESYCNLVLTDRPLLFLYPTHSAITCSTTQTFICFWKMLTLITPAKSGPLRPRKHREPIASSVARQSLDARQQCAMDPHTLLKRRGNPSACQPTAQSQCMAAGKGRVKGFSFPRAVVVRLTTKLQGSGSS